MEKIDTVFVVCLRERKCDNFLGVFKEKEKAEEYRDYYFKPYGREKGIEIFEEVLK